MNEERRQLNRILLDKIENLEKEVKEIDRKCDSINEQAKIANGRTKSLEFSRDRIIDRLDDVSKIQREDMSWVNTQITNLWIKISIISAGIGTGGAFLLDKLPL